MNDWFMYEDDGNLAVEAMMQDSEHSLRLQYCMMHQKWYN